MTSGSPVIAMCASAARSDAPFRQRPELVGVDDDVDGLNAVAQDVEHHRRPGLPAHVRDYAWLAVHLATSNDLVHRHELPAPAEHEAGHLVRALDRFEGGA